MREKSAIDNDTNETSKPSLSSKVKELIKAKRFNECFQLISEAMKENPHAAEPHNLMGMLMEEQGKLSEAMKHFRASWDLDPTYLPARYNMEIFGSFLSNHRGAYDENGCPEFEDDDDEKQRYEVEYDSKHIEHVVRRK